eukprot:6198750-Pleurochrysis_carterae.AAC.2
MICSGPEASQQQKTGKSFSSRGVRGDARALRSLAGSAGLARCRAYRPAANNDDETASKVFLRLSSTDCAPHKLMSISMRYMAKAPQQAVASGTAAS